MKRFLVYDGYVTSPNDGDEHFISCEEVMRLHGVRPSECICVRTRGETAREQGFNDRMQLAGVKTETLLKLEPMTHGAGYWPVSPLERSQYPTDASEEERKADVLKDQLRHGTLELERYMRSLHKQR